MRMSRLGFIVLIATGAFGGLFAGASNKANSKKFYVNKSDVKFCEPGIQVRTSKGVVATKAIHVDKKGAYFFESEVIKFEEKGRMSYVCSGCGAEFSSRDAQRIHEWSCPYLKHRR